jgi:hypothetical protein
MTRVAHREPGVIPVTACLGRDRKAADAADRKRAKTRNRVRELRRRRNGDKDVFRVRITVDYALASELVGKGFLAEWSMEDRTAVQTALQTYLDQCGQYD